MNGTQVQVSKVDQPQINSLMWGNDLNLFDPDPEHVAYSECGGNADQNEHGRTCDERIHRDEQSKDIIPDKNE